MEKVETWRHVSARQANIYKSKQTFETTQLCQLRSKTCGTAIVPQVFGGYALVGWHTPPTYARVQLLLLVI
eukprot:4190565-Amphidinium_carterae.1